MKPAWPRHWSLMVKLPLTITLMVFAAALIMGLVVIERDGKRQSARLEQQTLALARAVAAAGQEGLLSRDVWALYRTLDQLVDHAASEGGDAAVIDAMFLDPSGIVLAHTNPTDNPIGLPLPIGDDAARQSLAHALSAVSAHLVPVDIAPAGVIAAVVPIRVDESSVGLLLLRSSTRMMEAQLRVDALLVLAFALGLAFVTSAMGSVISRRMVSPLRDLSLGLGAVTRGEHGPVPLVEALDRDEIGQLTEQFNLMVDELAKNKRLEQDLANAERLAGLGRFAAGLAHEVNNPLGGMKNCVAMLARRPDDVDLVRKYVPLLDSGLNRIAATLQSLLAELRGESTLHACEMGCLGGLEGMVRAAIGESAVTLEWAVTPQDLSGVAIRCSCPQVNQIVLNLTRNALTALAGAGWLRVATRREGQEIVLEVADNGPGIDASAQRQLFEPFYTTSRQGSGLGLWITYNLIQRMGGRISVDSAPGQGARFTVHLPLVAATLATTELATTGGTERAA